VAVDAAAPPVEVDAAPEAETLEVTIKTDPPGAMVAVDGVDKGPSPVTLRLVVHDHFTEIVATAPDHDDKTITFNTYVNKDKLYPIKLKKTPKGAPPVRTRPTPPPDKTGSGGDGTRPSDRTGGELNGNPFKSDGNARPQKP
jgi:hypothetical protein